MIDDHDDHESNTYSPDLETIRNILHTIPFDTTHFALFEKWLFSYMCEVPPEIAAPVMPLLFDFHNNKSMDPKLKDIMGDIWDYVYKSARGNWLNEKGYEERKEFFLKNFEARHAAIDK